MEENLRRAEEARTKQKTWYLAACNLSVVVHKLHSLVGKIHRREDVSEIDLAMIRMFMELLGIAKLSSDTQPDTKVLVMKRKGVKANV